jgi:hypothetical protein
MRKLVLSLIVLALGLSGAFLAFSPRAGAHSLTGTFTGHVGSSGDPDAFQITLNTGPTVAPGTYMFNITDFSTIHNFDLCKGASCTGSNSVDKTQVGGTGSVSWSVTLTNGTYHYQCDIHGSQMRGSFTVGTSTAVTASITSVVAKRTLVTVAAKANQPVKFTASVLKNGKVLATKATTTNAASATIRLKPSPALKPGTYVVQVRAVKSGTNFKVVRKQVHVS